MLMINELPQDLVEQILVWLPVVSLLRLKCVCKSWYALITHKNFITKQILHNKNNSNTHLLLKTLDKITKDYAVSTLSYETLQVSLTQPLPPPYFEIDKKIVPQPHFKVEILVVGSCNGVVCLHDNCGLSIVLWNPATRETKVVPESNLLSCPAGHPVYFNGIGFGFDAKTNDYKIINLRRTMPDPTISHSRIQCIFQSEVYSLSADSWRKVDSDPCFSESFRGSRTYINGMVSWEAYCHDWEGVLSFDVSDEVFLKTWLPDDVIGNPLRHIFELNELIAMAVTIIDEEWSEFCFDIWLMHEVGVKDSWTKLFTVGPFTEIERPLGVWKNDTQTMFFEHFEGQPVLYDSSTKEITNLQIGHEVTRCLHLQLVTYMETLVSVKGGNEFEEQGNC
ncbi:F-box/kelch-repeat protein At3g23880-like [Corylus avellana]|uniref:F-box/kelch-repeat protein At3g23880-like n=1 Tax=Corylus avellana TaxID=13451 RepID=UPI001E215A2C|nr:F-box/kelch-repeat protein At3g23880-like [Corylus avellana]